MNQYIALLLLAIVQMAAFAPTFAAERENRQAPAVSCEFQTFNLETPQLLPLLERGFFDRNRMIWVDMDTYDKSLVEKIRQGFSSIIEQRDGKRVMVANWNLEGRTLEAVESWFFTGYLTDQYQRKFDALKDADILVVVLDPDRPVKETGSLINLIGPRVRGYERLGTVIVGSKQNNFGNRPKFELTMSGAVAYRASNFTLNLALSGMGLAQHVRPSPYGYVLDPPVPTRSIERPPPSPYSDYPYPE